MSAVEFFLKMRTLCVELVSAGKPFLEENLVNFVLTGFVQDFENIVVNILARPVAP